MFVSKTPAVACLGDSLTFGYGVRRDECWVSLAAAQSGVDLRNHGLNGDTTGGMLVRLNAEIIPSRPAAVLFMGGANDSLFEGSSGPARANMTAMTHAVASKGIVPLVGIPLPFVPPVREDWASLTDFVKAAAEYDDYALWLRQFCAVFHFQAVDFRDSFEGHLRRTGDAAAGYFSDGLHPNAAGHRVMAGCMVEALTALLACRVSR